MNGKYTNAECTMEAKGGKGGKFELRAYGECYATKKGNYTDAKCEKVAEKGGKPDHKGKFELAADVTGTITEEESKAGVAGVAVSVCKVETTECTEATTGSSGYYQAGVKPGEYVAHAAPPAEAPGAEATSEAFNVPEGKPEASVNIALVAPKPPPPGAVVGGLGNAGNGVPRLRHGCNYAARLEHGRRLRSHVHRRSRGTLLMDYP